MKTTELESLFKNEYELIDDENYDEDFTGVRTYSYKKDEEINIDITYDLVTKEIIDITIRNPFIDLSDDSPISYDSKQIYAHKDKIDLDKYIPYFLKIIKNPVIYHRDLLENHTKNLEWVIKELIPVLEVCDFEITGINLEDLTVYWRGKDVWETFWIDTDKLTGKLRTYFDEEIEITVDMDSGVLYEIFQEYFLKEKEHN